MGLMTDQTVQTALSIGVPSLAVLVGILVNNSRLSDLNSRIGELRSDIRLSSSDLRSIIADSARLQEANLRRVEEVLDARLRHIEERLKIA